MKRKSIIFLSILLIALVVTFGIHLGVLTYLEQPLFENLIALSYLVNFILAAVILFFVERSIKQESSQTGFIFIAGSALKFLVFFIVFNPVYKADGEMRLIEFTTFFVPYAICLMLEVVYLSKQLNNQSSSE